MPGFVNVHSHLPSIFVRGVYGVVSEGLYKVLFPILVIFVVLLVEPKGILEILSRVSRWIKRRQNALRESP